uniref:Uncharacterized protein n=1 Tax=Anguilla anguilla TaxID=7936 RepID=A0A0E9XP38_ANGAN
MFSLTKDRLAAEGSVLLCFIAYGILEVWLKKPVVLLYRKPLPYVNLQV